MIVIDNFSGVGCVSKTLKKMGHISFASDIVDREHIDYVCDILNFDPKKLGVIPNVLWFSPPCEKYSNKTNVKGGGNYYFQTFKKDGKVDNVKIREDFEIDKRLHGKKEKYTGDVLLHLQFLEKCFELIDYYSMLNPNLIWFIENPANGYMKFVIGDRAPYHNYCTYCPYWTDEERKMGFTYMKATNIFSNIKLNLKSCIKRPGNWKGDWCHTDNFTQRWDHKAQDFKMGPQSYNDRSVIPVKLIEDIFIQAEAYLKKTHKLAKC